MLILKEKKGVVIEGWHAASNWLARLYVARLMLKLHCLEPNVQVFIYLVCAASYSQKSYSALRI